jgi:hypothetical protein
MQSIVRFAVFFLVVSMLGGVSPVLGQPSTNLDHYLLFAEDELRIKGIRTPGGDLGVNDGLLFGTIDAPASTLAAKEARLRPKTKCGELFANEVARETPACGPPTAFSTPIVADIAAACGFPAPFDCGGGEAVTVGKGVSRSLTPGTYGAVRVMGGGGKAGTLRFAAGDYVLCSLRAARDARLLFDGAARVMVVGDIEVGNETFTGPASGSGLSPFDVRFFSAGDRVHFSRKSRVEIRLCAPDALLLLTEGTNLTGSFVARLIRTERVTGGSTTTTSTTSTTAPSTSTSTSTTAPPTTPTTAVTPTTVTTTTTKTTTTTVEKTTSTTTVTTSTTTNTCPTTTTMMMMGPGD